MNWRLETQKMEHWRVGVETHVFLFNGKACNASLSVINHSSSIACMLHRRVTLDEDSKAPFLGFEWIIYHGTPPDGQEVVMKVGSATSTRGTREFENENDQQILVYPFMSNGSLQDRLYGEASKRKVLDWPTRISIALGLFYLHTFAGRGVIHRDVKSSNILLDHSMYAKVAENCRKTGKLETGNWKTGKLSFVDWFHEMCSYQFVVLLIGCRTLQIS
ncbi:hypothetical protein Sjap_020063 [Stephania japonica]|uniref:Protein kinase domain-containing protein n=1 Tax=Stephania japonica TaxID=461633 RepID=A0AAP0I0D7_9MAGN